MSKSKERKQEATRTQVGNLTPQERELKAEEAEKVQGGGGLAGGVLPTNPSSQVSQTSK